MITELAPGQPKPLHQSLSETPAASRHLHLIITSLSYLSLFQTYKQPQGKNAERTIQQIRDTVESIVVSSAHHRLAFGHVGQAKH